MLAQALDTRVLQQLARCVATTILGAAALADGADAQTHAGQYEQADIEYGARLYSGQCVVCHGERGDAMPGVALGSGKFKNASTDRELTNVIRDGVAGTAMAPSGYSEPEIAAVIAYLRNMGRADLSGVNVGDAARGRDLFIGKGDCDRCHRVVGQGPRTAPDLTSIGTLRTAATLQRSLRDPDAALLPINRPVRIVTRDGAVITGRRLNEDTHTVQLVDERERLISLDKSELTEYSVTSEAQMPSYENLLTDEERADLVAYLLALKGIN